MELILNLRNLVGTKGVCKGSQQSHCLPLGIFLLNVIMTQVKLQVRVYYRYEHTFQKEFVKKGMLFNNKDTRSALKLCITTKYFDWLLNFDLASSGILFCGHDWLCNGNECTKYKTIFCISIYNYKCTSNLCIIIVYSLHRTFVKVLF